MSKHGVLAAEIGLDTLVDQLLPAVETLARCERNSFIYFLVSLIYFCWQAAVPRQCWADCGPGLVQGVHGGVRRGGGGLHAGQGDSLRQRRGDAQRVAHGRARGRGALLRQVGRIEASSAILLRPITRGDMFVSLF